LKDDKVFVRHILDEVDFIIEKSKDLEFEELTKNEVLKRAFARSLEIIGEATKNISEEFKEKHPDIGWKELAGLRDKLIHHYFGLNWIRVWDVIKNFIPKLKNQIEVISKEEK